MLRENCYFLSISIRVFKRIIPDRIFGMFGHINHHFHGGEEYLLQLLLSKSSVQFLDDVYLGKLILKRYNRYNLERMKLQKRKDEWSFYVLKK